MEATARVQGLESAIKALQAAFPNDPKQARKLLNQSMSGAAKKTIIPLAKQFALQGDKSGALSEAIKPRAVSLGRSLAQGKAAIVHITPVRNDRAAIAKYIAYYYNARGLSAPASVVTGGIRHGHLVEFGFVHKSGVQVERAPFLAPAQLAGYPRYVRQFAQSLKVKTERAVRRKARQGRKR